MVSELILAVSSDLVVDNVATINTHRHTLRTADFQNWVLRLCCCFFSTAFKDLIKCVVHHPFKNDSSWVIPEKGINEILKKYIYQ